LGRPRLAVRVREPGGPGDDGGQVRGRGANASVLDQTHPGERGAVHLELETPALVEGDDLGRPHRHRERRGEPEQRVVVGAGVAQLGRDDQFATTAEGDVECEAEPGNGVGEFEHRRCRTAFGRSHEREPGDHAVPPTRYPNTPGRAATPDASSTISARGGSASRPPFGTGRSSNRRSTPSSERPQWSTTGMPPVHDNASDEPWLARTTEPAGAVFCMMINPCWRPV
jgi:hypothetical protein